MVIEMTNRLLAVVIAVTVSATVAAHAAQAGSGGGHAVQVGLPLASMAVRIHPRLPAAVPAALTTAAASLSRGAQEAIDPESLVVTAYQRDHDALEHLRQQASVLSSPAHAAFNQLLDADQLRLATLERSALDYQSGDAGAAVASMDQVVAQARTALTAALSAAAGVKQHAGPARRGGSRSGR